MAYKYTVPAKNGRLKYRLRTSKKDEITNWTVYPDRVEFISKYRQKELDRRSDVIVEEVEG